MDERLSPEEISRLMSLPPDHPDRRRAAASPEFESLSRLRSEFEGIDAPRSSREPEPLVAWLAGLLRRPAARLGAAFTGVMLLAGVAWWSRDLASHDRRLRAAARSAGFAVSSLHATPGALVIGWTAAPHADGYRLRFLGAELNQVAELRDLHTTEVVLHADNLPAGLESLQEVSIEVVAFRRGEALATAPARTIRLP